MNLYTCLSPTVTTEVLVLYILITGFKNGATLPVSQLEQGGALAQLKFYFYIF